MKNRISVLPSVNTFDVLSNKSYEGSKESGFIQAKAFFSSLCITSCVSYLIAIICIAIRQIVMILCIAFRAFISNWINMYIEAEDLCWNARTGFDKCF